MVCLRNRTEPSPKAKLAPVSQMGAAESAHEPRRHGKTAELNPRFQISGRQVFGQRRVGGLGQLEGRKIDAVDRMAGVAQRGPRARQPAQRGGHGNLADENRLGEAVDHVHHPHAAVQVETTVIVHVDRRLDVVLAGRVAGPAWLGRTSSSRIPCRHRRVHGSGRLVEHVSVFRCVIRTVLLTGS